MKYGALTIDTTIIQGKGYNFTSGILGALNQFKHSATELLFSNVVIGEIRNHLVADHKKLREAHISSLNDLKRKYAISEQASENIMKIVSGEVALEEYVNGQIDRFIEDTGAEIVTAEFVTGDSLLDLYFNFNPPFENNASKKNEFPDAIALLSIEQWAKENSCQVIAVSKDKGWAKFAASSEYIDVVDDLSTALNEIADLKDFYVKELINKLIDGMDDEGTDEHNFISDIFYGQEFYSDAFAEVWSNYDYIETQELRIAYNRFNLANSIEPEYKIIKYSADEVILQLDIIVDADVTGVFEIYVEDPIDKDYVLIDTVSATRDKMFSASLLLMFTVDDVNVGDDGYEAIIELTAAELLDLPQNFDFDFIEPDFED